MNFLTELGMQLARFGAATKRELLREPIVTLLDLRPDETATEGKLRLADDLPKS